jgi:hypothetical protein
MWGYYDKKLLSYYPQPLEWQFRDEYPADDAINFQEQFSPNEWDSVDENANVINQSGQSPDQFLKEVEQLKAKYQLNKPNLWENTQAKH